MPVADLVMNSDLYKYPYGCTCGSSTSTTGDTNDKQCTCNNTAYIIPPPPPAIDVCRFPYPPYPAYPYPVPAEDVAVKQNAVEKKICKKSKEAATLRQIIENLEDKNKNLIVKSGSVSYSLGAYKTKDPDDPEIDITDDNIESVIEILKSKLESVKEEIKELSDKLVDD